MARAHGGAASSPVGTWIGRALALVLGAGLLWVAVAGGEYGTVDLLRQAARRDSVAAEVAALQRQRDSLQRAYDQLRTDPWRLEQLAREEHGMVQGDKELLYRLSRPSAEADSAALPPDP